MFNTMQNMKNKEYIDEISKKLCEIGYISSSQHKDEKYEDVKKVEPKSKQKSINTEEKQEEYSKTTKQKEKTFQEKEEERRKLSSRDSLINIE